MDLPAGDRALLTSWLRDPALPARTARRARIVLLAADGVPVKDIVAEVGASRPTVIAWRKRYAAGGPKALVDRPRPGRPPAVDEARVVAATREPPPPRLGAVRWSSRLLAAELGISHVRVARIWKRHGLRPWRTEPGQGTSVTADGDRGALNPAELRAWRGLIETSALLRHRLDRLLLADSGLSGSDYPVLVRLSEADTGALRSSELAEGIGWERSRLSHHLARMERRGLVERRRHATDSRGSEVHLTGHGRRTYLGATRAHSRAVRTHFADALGPGQVDALGEIMDALARHLAPAPPAGAPVPRARARGGRVGA